MKSAYEIAMARLEKEHGPGQVLSEAQKQQIADIDKRYDAKAAELRLAVDAKLQGVTTQDEYDQLQASLAEGLAGLNEQREKEKEAVRHAQ